MRFLLRMVPYESDIGSATRVLRGIASSMGGKAVNPKRTSYGAVEMDIFVESRADFDVFLAALEPLGRLEFYRDLQEDQHFLPTAQAIKEVISLFNSERFWEAHEVLESKWRVAQGDEKRLLQGLILVCAAFVHHQKDEEKVALGIVQRAALKLLVWKNRLYFGIDIPALRERMEQQAAKGSLSRFEI